MGNEKGLFKRLAGITAVVAISAVAAALLTAFAININTRKIEAASSNIKLNNLSEDDTDPAKWGIDFPRQYDGYLRTAQKTATTYGGDGGSETLPPQKIERDPWLKRAFAGYAFSIDYRDRRGHAYMLTDQETTKRLTKPQTGSCLHCHASIMPLFKKMGSGNAEAGMNEAYKHSYQELNKQLHDMGHGHAVGCVDCHEPNTMRLRVTRPGFIKAMRELAASNAPVPVSMPSMVQWRSGSRSTPYDPNSNGSRQEMRSFVCGQCHVEYYCGSAMPLTFPWSKGLTADSIESFWNSTKIHDTSRFYDYKHAETGAEILKAQHPEFELWNQGIHARSGVSCADCHMPYMREGASKISDHWVRSPLLNINRACQTCHRFPEQELRERVAIIQDRNHQLLQRGGVALINMIDAIVAAKAAGVSNEALKPALELHRKAQWRLDYIVAENSMGFHAPQEAARILGEAIDYARQGQVVAIGLQRGATTKK